MVGVSSLPGQEDDNSASLHWEQKRAIYAILLNIIILGAVWVFIPWLWVCIVLSIIIPVIGFVIFVLWGMFRFACVQNPFGALFNLYMFKIK
jgi:hypothetical protein